MRAPALVVLAFPLAAACATERLGSEGPSAPSFSTPSASFQTSYVSRGSTFVDRVHVNADLVVRPDRVCVPVQLTASAADPASAMKLVEDAAEALRAAGGPAVLLRVDDIDARSDRVGAGDKATVRSSVSMRGVVETALATEGAGADPWTRARKVAQLHRAVVERSTPPDGNRSAKEGDATLVVGVGNPEPGVADIEQHRAKLLASWTERARALATAATFDGATLELLGCVPPAQVQVVGGTLEKVGLSLPVSCTFQVRKLP